MSDGSPPLKRNYPKAPVLTEATRTPYQNYFGIQEHDIRVPRFDGTYSRLITRAAFRSGDAIAVLPYDAQRDRVMLIEQFRFGPHIRGDQTPWKFEAVAGRIDRGENPVETVHRELAEETGIKVKSVLAGPKFYPAPGAVDEFMYTFIGLTNLTENQAGVSGLAAEDEDIKSHIMHFDAAMALFEDGVADTGPLVTCLLWLALHRNHIRAGA